jgi:hypothetical protein
MSIVLPHLPLRGIRTGERWSQGSLACGTVEVGRFALEVRHLRNEVGNQRIGLALRDASEGQMQKLRRVLLRLQSPAR